MSMNFYGPYLLRSEDKDEPIAIKYGYYPTEGDALTARALDANNAATAKRVFIDIPVDNPMEMAMRMCGELRKARRRWRQRQEERKTACGGGAHDWRTSPCNCVVCARCKIHSACHAPHDKAPFCSKCFRVFAEQGALSVHGWGGEPVLCPEHHR